jgi:ATP-dependent Lhr-like helicase
MLARIKGRIQHRALERVSPLAVPALLEIGRERVYGAAMDELLDEAAAALLRDAGLAAPDDYCATSDDKEVNMN